MFMATALWGVHSTLAAAPLFGFSIIFGMWNDKYTHLKVYQIITAQIVGIVVTTTYHVLSVIVINFIQWSHRVIVALKGL